MLHRGPSPQVKFTCQKALKRVQVLQSLQKAYSNSTPHGALLVFAHQLRIPVWRTYADY
jgi:hypothetical protein